MHIERMKSYRDGDTFWIFRMETKERDFLISSFLKELDQYRDLSIKDSKLYLESYIASVEHIVSFLERMNHYTGKDADNQVSTIISNSEVAFIIISLFDMFNVSKIVNTNEKSKLLNQIADINEEYKTFVYELSEELESEPS